MSVYVDPLFFTSAFKTYRWRYNESCHMMADTEEELLQMARKIGLKQSWFQKRPRGLSHFDLTKNKRKLAVKYGAIEVDSSKELIKHMKGIL
jgi:hypothetical protein